MITVLAFYGAGLAINAATRDLLTDVRLAMKRADLSVDFTARAINVPPCKLSLQLNGQAPFTHFWRFVAAQEIRESDFWVEFLELRAKRIDRAFMQSDLASLVASVTELVSESKKQMARAELPAVQKSEVA